MNFYEYYSTVMFLYFDYDIDTIATSKFNCLFVSKIFRLLKLGNVVKKMSAVKFLQLLLVSKAINNTDMTALYKAKKDLNYTVILRRLITIGTAYSLKRINSDICIFRKILNIVQKAGK